MKSSLKIKVLPLLLLMLIIALASFRSSKDIYSYVQNWELKNVKNLEADIKINAGTLRLSTHSQSNASFSSSYTRNTWKADAKMDQQAGRLSIHQPEEKNMNMKDEDKNDWQIKIPKNLSTDLNLIIGAGEGILDLDGSKLNNMQVKMGAGKFDVNLANTSLSNLEVKAGVGALTVDLSGKQDKNLQATIEGGIGEIKILLPRQVGVRVKVNGLGSIDRNDLKKKDGYYVNDAYGKTANNIDIKVSGGLGSLEMTMSN